MDTLRKHVECLKAQLNAMEIMVNETRDELMNLESLIMDIEAEEFLDEFQSEVKKEVRRIFSDLSGLK